MLFLRMLLLLLLLLLLLHASNPRFRRRRRGRIPHRLPSCFPSLDPRVYARSSGYVVVKLHVRAVAALQLRLGECAAERTAGARRDGERGDY
jgi:hypothetical protein